MLHLMSPQCVGKSTNFFIIFLFPVCKYCLQHIFSAMYAFPVIYSFFLDRRTKKGAIPVFP